MISRLHRRALLQWFAATGLSLPVLVDAPLAASPNDATQDLEAFLDALLQQLFPHPALDAGTYGAVATVMTGAIQAQPPLAGLVAAGRAELDAADDLRWIERDPDEQLANLEAIASTPFFLALRGLGGFLFYNTPDVWALLGYEGPSFEKGGYLGRGFDDIDWLPEPEQCRLM